jgi:hypothetical protein
MSENWRYTAILVGLLAFWLVGAWADGGWA